MLNVLLATLTFANTALLGAIVILLVNWQPKAAPCGDRLDPCHVIVDNLADNRTGADLPRGVTADLEPPEPNDTKEVENTPAQSSNASREPPKLDGTKQQEKEVIK